MTEFEPNCVGYAFHRLRINSSEVYVDPKGLDLNKYFDPAVGPETADALLIIYTDPLEGEKLVHISVFDAINKDFVWHRPGYGRSGRIATLDGLKNEFNNTSFDIRFVKLKPALVPT